MTPQEMSKVFYNAITMNNKVLKKALKSVEIDTELGVKFNIDDDVENLHLLRCHIFWIVSEQRHLDSMATSLMIANASEEDKMAFTADLKEMLEFLGGKCEEAITKIAESQIKEIQNMMKTDKKEEVM